jgi:hypothetical protein
MPALFTIISTPPNASAVAANAFSIVSLLVTSRATEALYLFQTVFEILPSRFSFFPH